MKSYDDLNLKERQTRLTFDYNFKNPSITMKHKKDFIEELEIYELDEID